MKIHILDDWFDTIKTLPCFELLKNHEITIWTDHIEDVNILIERLHEAEVLVLFRERSKITRQLVQSLPNLRLISQRSVYPHIDVEACTNHNVLLCSNMHNDTPSYAAAELTFGLILAAMRQIPQQMISTKAGKWQIGVGKTLRGRTLGLYGYGRIARVVESYAHAFGMHVQWWGSEAGRQRAQEDSKIVAESRQLFFATSDVVSLHVRLKPETKSIITHQDFTSMKSGSLFVNTSRAGLIEPEALLAALNNGKPAQAAIDVFDTEPLLDANDPLLSHPNLICTPHIGFVTEDEFELQFKDIFKQIQAYYKNAPINMINPEVWKKS